MIRIIENNRSIDADAWVRRYLVAASADRGVGLAVIFGIMASVLISRLIHMSNQCELSRVIKVPMIRVV